MFLNKDQILSSEDLPFEEMEMPEWGGKVNVRGLTGKERDAFEESIADKSGEEGAPKVNLNNFRAKLVVLTVVDENGKRVFSDTDADALGKKSARAINRVFEKARKLSGIGKDDVEEMTKNLQTTQDESSNSD